MKYAVCLALAVGGIAVQAQERLPREEALKYATITAMNLKEMTATPIPTDPDIKRPVAYRDENYGAMMLPESKLSECLAKAGKDVVPVGQLWLVKLAPMKDGSPIPESKLRKVHLSAGDQEVDVICCALGIAKEGDSAQLVVFGKDKEPILKVPLKSASSSQENPLDFTAERQDDGGLLTVKIGGKYEGTFKVTDPSQY